MKNAHGVKSFEKNGEEYKAPSLPYGEYKNPNVIKNMKNNKKASKGGRVKRKTSCSRWYGVNKILNEQDV